MRVWPNASGLETSWCAGIIWSGNKLVCRNHPAQFLAQCNWPTTSFPLLESVAFFHKHPGSHSAKSTWIRFFSGGLCQVLAKRIWCARIIRPASGQCFQANPDQIQIRSDMFTGKIIPIVENLKAVSKIMNRALLHMTSLSLSPSLSHTHTSLQYMQLTSLHLPTAM